MGMISQHHDSAGWTAILVVAFLLSCMMVMRWLRYDLQAHDRRCVDVLLHPPHRLMAGTILIFAGTSIRLIAELVGKPMIEAQSWVWLIWWSGISHWVVTTGAALIVAGILTMMWPAISARLGRATIPAVIGGLGMIYAAGAAAVMLAASWF